MHVSLGVDERLLGLYRWIMVQVVRRGRIRIAVYPETGERHNTPHCHVYWPDGRCSIALDTMRLLAGKQPPAGAWRLLDEFRDDLRRAWTALNDEEHKT
jgi:Domain of unknown function (DUF4160)